MRAPLLLSVLLLAPVLTGCLSDDPQAEAPSAAGPVAANASEAGAVAGPAPVAPKTAYTVAPDPEKKEETAVAYPALVETNPAKPPVTLDLSGEFKPHDCRGLNFGGAEGVLRQVSNHRRYHDLSEALAVGDVFQYEILFRYESKQTASAEIHPTFGIGNTVREHDEPTFDARGPVEVNWTGQGFRATDEDMAWIQVACWYGVMTEAIPYTLTVTFTFGDSAVPAEAPILVPVPEGATRMFVRGVALDPARGVLSHFRLFGPDDEVVCECALSSDREVAVVPLAQEGDHVLLVDHTDNGFVSVAFDAPPSRPLKALASEWVRSSVVTSTGGPVAQTVDLDFPKVPLFLMAHVIGPDDATPGTGRQTKLHVENGRGEVLRYAWAGHLAMQPNGGDRGAWLGLGPGEWESWVDHHAFAPGAHVAHVEAGALRGEVIVITRQYVR